MSVKRLKVVGVMGSGSNEHADLAEPLGKLIASLNAHLLTGGGSGVMTSVSRAFSKSDRVGLTIGVLPCKKNKPRSPKHGYPNQWIEVPIATHLDGGQDGHDLRSRNHINILSCDAVVALPGGAGTSSEVSLAVQYGCKVLAYLGASGTIPSLPAQVSIARSRDAVEKFLRDALKAPAVQSD